MASWEIEHHACFDECSAVLFSPRMAALRCCSKLVSNRIVSNSTPSKFVVARSWTSSTRQFARHRRRQGESPGVGLPSVPGVRRTKFGSASPNAPVNCFVGGYTTRAWVTACRRSNGPADKACTSRWAATRQARAERGHLKQGRFHGQTFALSRHC